MLFLDEQWGNRGVLTVKKLGGNENVTSFFVEQNVTQAMVIPVAFAKLCKVFIPFI